MAMRNRSSLPLSLNGKRLYPAIHCGWICNRGQITVRKISFFQNRSVAKISKKWRGMLKEGFTDADTFVLSFAGLDLNTKITLMGAVFLIDFMYYES